MPDSLHPWIHYTVGRMPRLRNPDPDAQRFGAIVRRLRDERGWTREKLATRSGLTPQYLAIVEQGGNVPSLTTVLELLEVLGADAGAVVHELSAARNTPRQ